MQRRKAAAESEQPACGSYYVVPVNTSDTLPSQPVLRLWWWKCGKRRIIIRTVIFHNVQ